MTDLIKYRLESARERIESSKLELDIGHFKISITAKCMLLVLRAYEKKSVNSLQW